MTRFVCVALAAFATIASVGPAAAYSRHGYYRSSDGSTVHVPYRSHHSGETAICRDGSHSMSHHHRGTCSHHGGVARFER